jgi:pilus assembly protein Flp/PilA
MAYQAFLTWMRCKFNQFTAAVDLDGRARQAESGQGLVEYALIIILVGVVVMAIMIILGPAISNMYRNIVAQF